MQSTIKKLGLPGLEAAEAVEVTAEAEVTIPTALTSTRCRRLSFCLMAWDRSESLIRLFTASNKSSQVQVIL